MSAETLPFTPLFRSGHLQTIAARFWPAQVDLRKFPVVSTLFQTEPGVQVLTHCHFASSEMAKETVLIVHGLEGSSHSPYVLRMSQRALEEGYDVVRLNVRNCGGTEHLSATLYHSGLTKDLESVALQLAPRPLYIIGFSMGGNMALKLAGEWGTHLPGHVKAVCAVSPPIDLETCARKISEPRNRIYERRFLVHLGETLSQKKRKMPVNYTLEQYSSIRTLIDFDHVYTAPAFGYRDAFDYYTHASSISFLGRIQAETLVIHAQDDPFIPPSLFAHPAFDSNPYLKLLLPSHGGHVAFIARGRPRFWAQDRAVHFFNSIRWRADGTHLSS
ncbi:MAG: alpha/beta fold hydrolase [Terriglobia bacterium]